jgi:hypothetical protein
VSFAGNSRLVARALCAVIALAGCRGGKKSEPKTSLPPLAASSWLVPIETPGFAPALAALPLGARSPRPVLIAIHGSHDRPEWACGSYRGIAGGNPFILCPRGPSLGDQAFTLGTTANTAAELRAALPALKARFRAHVAAGSVVLAGLGPAVEHAIDLALKEPKFFSHLLLVDGSIQRFTLPAATRFGAAGGRRVLVVCSTGACDPDVEDRLRTLGPSGVATRIVRPPRGHGLDADMVAALRAEFPWLVINEPRWR